MDQVSSRKIVTMVKSEECVESNWKDPDGLQATEMKVKLPSNLSHLDKYFEPSQIGNKLKCKQCHKDIAYNPTSNFGIKKHYKNMHPAYHAAVLAAISASSKRGLRHHEDRSSDTSSLKRKQASTEPAFRHNFDQATALDIYYSLVTEVPAYITESEAFRSFLNYLNPEFEVPSIEGYASSSGTSRGQPYEDQTSILPEEDRLVCEPEFEEKYHPPVQYYQSQAGASDASKTGHETEESEGEGASRGIKGDALHSDGVLQEDMVSEEVTVTPHIPTTLIDSSSSNSSTRATAANPPSGRASPEMAFTPYHQSNGIQQSPVGDSPMCLKQTAAIPEPTVNGTFEHKRKHPRLLPYALPYPQVLNMDEQYLDAEERRLVLELERKRLNLEEKRLQVEESEKNRRFALDEKRLHMEEEDRKRTRMNEKKRLELEERRVAMMEKKVEPEMKHWNMIDNFMNDALKILSQIIAAVGKIQGGDGTKDEDKFQDMIVENVGQELKCEKSVENLASDGNESSPKRRKRKRRPRSNSDSDQSSEESSSDSETQKFTEKETAVLLKEVETKKSVLLSTSSDSETVAKKKSMWIMVAQSVGGGRTAEDVRNVWLSLRRKSRRKYQKITTAPVNLTEAEKTVIRILSVDQVKLKS